MTKIKTVVFSLLPLLVVLIALEVTGRIIYPFNLEQRALIKAERDPRLELSYLSKIGDGLTILYDIHSNQSRYIPFLGWIGMADASMSTITTNALGFRDKPLQSRKVKEYRILILGGSTAWGLGASSNQSTIAGALELLLNKSSGDVVYRVMSGAYQGWQSRQELIALMEFYEYFDPDYVIALTGYNDLHVLSLGGDTDLQMRSENHLLAKAVDASLKPMGTMQALRKTMGSLGVWRIVVYFREKMQNASGARSIMRYDANKSARILPKMVDRYSTMSNYSKRHGVKLLIAIQPDIYTTKKILTSEEVQVKRRFVERYVNIGEVYSHYRSDALKYFSSLMVDGNSSLLDLAGVFDATSAPVFLDECHLNDHGYEVVSKGLFSAIRANTPYL